MCSHFLMQIHCLYISSRCAFMFIVDCNDLSGIVFLPLSPVCPCLSCIMNKYVIQTSWCFFKLAITSMDAWRTSDDFLPFPLPFPWCSILNRSVYVPRSSSCYLRDVLVTCYVSPLIALFLIRVCNWCAVLCRVLLYFSRAKHYDSSGLQAMDFIQDLYVSLRWCLYLLLSHFLMVSCS